MIEERIIVETSDGPMTALVWHPDGDGPFPVVVCYHDGPGLREAIYATARGFANAGFFTAVPDLYHRHGELITFDLPQLRQPGSAEAERFWQIISSTTVEAMAADTAALSRQLAQNRTAGAGPRACIGFCHTARTVIRVMADYPADFPVGAIMHPSFTVTDSPDSPHLSVKDITGRIYAGFGGADTTAPLSEQQPLIDELADLGDRAIIEILPNGGHGFLWSEAPGYDADGAKSAWQNALDLFNEQLKKPTQI